MGVATREGPCKDAAGQGTGKAEEGNLRQLLHAGLPPPSQTRVSFSYSGHTLLGRENKPFLWDRGPEDVSPAACVTQPRPLLMLELLQAEARTLLFNAWGRCTSQTGLCTDGLTWLSSTAP